MNWTFTNFFSRWYKPFSRRQGRAPLQVQAAVRVIADQDRPDKAGKYVCVEVRNVGTGEATVHGLYWTTGVFRKRVHRWKPPPHDYSGSIPTTLQNGQQTSYLLATYAVRYALGDMLARSVAGFVPGFKAYFIRIGAKTSTGHRASSRIDGTLRREFLRVLALRKKKTA